MNGCPYRPRISTMAVESQTDVKAKNRKLSDEVIGGRRGIMVSSARHQPPTAVIARQTTAADIRGGYGCCFECVRKADEDGEVPVDRGPGVCGGLTAWVVCDCDC